MASVMESEMADVKNGTLILEIGPYLSENSQKWPFLPFLAFPYLKETILRPKNYLECLT